MLIKRAASRLPHWSIAAAWLLVLVGTPEATMTIQREFVCPVCDGEFEASVLLSTNACGQDRDFLEHALGEQPVLVYPVTCPHCFYSGYGSDFDPTVIIADDVKQQIADREALQPIVTVLSGWGSDEIPAWARYDLIAQTYQLLGRGEQTIANQYLSASWAVRVEEDFRSQLGDALLTKVQERISESWDKDAALAAGNLALYETAVGKELARNAERLGEEPRLLEALAAIVLLRPYGENTDIERMLSVLQPAMTDTAFERFEGPLSESISRERRFQAKAVALFETAITTGEDEEQKAVTTYLCAELHRRLENWGEARRFFHKCQQMEGLPEWLQLYIREQQELLPPR